MLSHQLNGENGTNIILIQYSSTGVPPFGLEEMFDYVQTFSKPKLQLF